MPISVEFAPSSSKTLVRRTPPVTWVRRGAKTLSRVEACRLVRISALDAPRVAMSDRALGWLGTRVDGAGVMAGLPGVSAAIAVLKTN